MVPPALRLVALCGMCVFAAVVAHDVVRGADAPPPPRPPAEHVYAELKGVPLKAYVFAPERPGRKRSGIVLFHGGGWAMGEPQWAFSRARHYAQRGMVAIAAQYRLSDQKEITPHEAVADARAAIRWVRAHAKSLGVDPKRIVAFGWSAGGHLAASAAIFDDAA